MKLLLKYMKPYRGLAIVTVLVLMVDIAGTLLVPTLLANMVNIGVATKNFNYILQNGLAMLGATALASGGALLGSYLSAKLAASVGRDIRNAVYDSSLAFSGSDFERFGTGSMITRTLNDINVIQQSIIMTIQMVLPVPIMCVMGIALATSIDYQMGILLAIVVAVVLVIAAITVANAAPIFTRLQRFIDRMNVVLRENITGVRVIRAFNKESHERRRMDGTFVDYADTSIKANRLFANLDGLSYFGMNAFIVVVYFLAGGRISAGNFQIGDITAIVEYAIMALFYLMMAQMVIITLPRALECCERVRLVLDHSPQIADPEPGAAVDMSGRGPLPDGEVLAFRDVTFRFADAQEDTLRHVSFSCKTGQTTAIIGGTGSGKSTIAMLALRFHDANWGEVTLDGVDVRKMTQHDLRRRVSYVQQQAWLFSGTIADNLRYGDRDASDERLNHAIDVAQAREFVDSLPQGLESRVAQGGTNFSGGQKQRLSIARALTGDTQLVVFDDSFSALDFKTDAALRHALAAETNGRAVLIIAQRVSTVQHADQIVVLSDGQVAGIGKHDELMADCEVYREIVESQTKEPAMGEEA